MNIHHVLLFCFSSAALFNGNTGLVNERSNLHTIMEGDDFKIALNFSVPTGSRKYLCRNDCTDENLLIQTHGNRAKSGRYTIRYDSNDNKVYTVITELKQSDAGRYKVGVSTSSSLGSYEEIEIKVRDLCDGVFGEPRVYSVTEGENITIICSLFSQPRNRKFLCREKCNKILFDTNDMSAMSKRHRIRYGNSGHFNVTFTQLTKSDSGRYWCGVGRQSVTTACQEFEITVAGGNNLLLVVCLTVAVVLTAVCVGLLLLYKRRKRNVDHVNTRGDGRNTEILYENSATVSTHEGPIYQELDPNSGDHNLYWSIPM